MVTAPRRPDRPRVPPRTRRGPLPPHPEQAAPVRSWAPASSPCASARGPRERRPGPSPDGRRRATLVPRVTPHSRPAARPRRARRATAPKVDRGPLTSDSVVSSLPQRNLLASESGVRGARHLYGLSMRFRSTESEPGQHLALEVVLSPVGQRRIAEDLPSFVQRRAGEDPLSRLSFPRRLCFQ